MDIWNVELQEICFKLRVAYYCEGVNAGFEAKGKFDVIRSPHNIVFCGGSDMNLIAHRLRRLLISAIASENGLVLPVAISSIPSLIWL